MIKILPTRITTCYTVYSLSLDICAGAPLFYFQEREARERLEREVVQQRELLTELAREVVRLQIFCTGAPGREPPGPVDLELIEGLETSKIV